MKKRQIKYKETEKHGPFKEQKISLETIPEEIQTSDLLEKDF